MLSCPVEVGDRKAEMAQEYAWLLRTIPDSDRSRTSTDAQCEKAKRKMSTGCKIAWLGFISIASVLPDFQ